jgi:hypothetical protein
LRDKYNSINPITVKIPATIFCHLFLLFVMESDKNSVKIIKNLPKESIIPVSKDNDQ